MNPLSTGAFTKLTVIVAVSACSFAGSGFVERSIRAGTSIAPLTDISRQAPSSTLDVVNLRTEYMHDPIGLDVRRPRLSWELRSSRRAVMQSAYQIRVAHDEKSLVAARSLVWETARVESPESIHRVYEGPALQSARRYYWSVRVWDEAGAASAWSRPAVWEMALLDPSEWRASWIEPDLPEDVSKPGPVPMLRREFELKGRIASARAYVTSRGLYEMYLNGRRVGDQVFTPGWTSYHKRIQYQTYDVTDLLVSGRNAAGVLLGNGWYRGEIGFNGQRNFYGDRVALLARIAITYADGRVEHVMTDESWKAASGPILMSEIYHGETYDARLEQPGWTMPGFPMRDGPASAWRATRRTPSSRRQDRRSGGSRRFDRRRSSRRLQAPPSLTWGRTWSAGSG